MTAATARPSSGALRRYPPLAFLLAAAALASLLPSALRVPIAGPQQTAELAPVPGRSSGDTGDLSQLGETGTNGLGGGLGGGAGRPGDTTTTTGLSPDAPGSGPPGLGSSPQGKRCVGKPARQTEDPLAPPCVAYYKGNNGGATGKGITADEVRMVLLTPCGTQNYAVDYWAPNASSQPGWINVWDAYARYFSERYQLYGRRLHFFGYQFSCGNSADVQARNSIIDVDRRWSPFAIVLTSTGAEETLADEAARRNIFVLYNTRRDTAQGVAPYLLSFPPDLDDRADIEAAFICTKLDGRVARYSGNVLDRTKTRRFGLVYDPQSGTGVSVEDLKIDHDLFLAALKRHCGITDLPEAVGRSPEQRAPALNDLRSKGVTTVLFYGKYTDWSTSADTLKWYPEWFLGGTEADPADVRSQAAAVWANAFGITYGRRRGPVDQQSWYEAFQEACPGCTLAASGPVFPQGYDDLTLLMWGIQAAGPRLTAANVDRGLHAIQPRPSPDPYTPAAYFTPGNYSWVKDAALVWWDPSGSTGQSATAGCYRLVESGTRKRAADWAPGDEGIKGTGDPNQPCQGPLY
ncbi:MAG TPA: hypothetical protein VFA94_06495 [Acidimicrobiales bacterium]|nr:hypothetical protein [Acidimicrobiales bacterium]